MNQKHKRKFGFFSLKNPNLPNELSFKGVQGVVTIYEGSSKKKVVSVHFGTLARAQPAELTARFSKYDFWNLGEIWDRNR